MGFIKDNPLTGFGGLGLAEKLLGNKKKPSPSLVAPQSTMYSTTPYSQPMSMIGSMRGGS